MKKKVLTIILVLFVVGVIHTALTDDGTSSETEVSGNDNTITEEVKNDDYKAFEKVISDDKLIENISKAMIEVGIDPQKISSLKQVNDWVAGERYNFVYKNNGLTIYTNMDSTVHSMRLGATTLLYLQGYEAYNIEDYLVGSDMRAFLQSKAEDKVKTYLNYPSTADFPLLDWSFGRDHELYSVSSSVKAKNAFGVESETPFTLTYKIQDNLSTLVYFIIDGYVVVNDEAALKRPERKEVAIQKDDNERENENTNEITLVYGQLGEYGKEITLDGYEYINYHVPQGTYTVKNKVKWCKMYVAKDEYFRNSDGYMENEIVETIELNSPDETTTITVNQGEHIELTINVSVTLIPE